MNVEGVAVRVLVRGIVQGVGFRPFIYSLAQKNSLKGWVRNTSGNVEIHLEGTSNHLEQFLFELQNRLPPLARIDSLQIIPTQPEYSNDFLILSSQSDPAQFQPIPPDTAICADCRRELFDPLDRRYHYPFINCTNCGPRFTITGDIPYDRPNTSMARFIMCPDCQREYDDPLDRRFHAQPNACPVCGPRLRLLDGGGAEVRTNDPVSEAVALLRQGMVVAVKGLGGVHLAVDATNEEAVRRLRARKQREEKPLAVMSPDTAAVKEYARLSRPERELLESRERPIVLLRKAHPCAIAESVAPGNAFVGVMLPYTPLHHLLLKGNFLALIMTSGNLSEEPIAKDNQEAVERLRGIADFFLVHDRDIVVRSDDSVLRVVDGRAMHIRRSRGYVPLPLVLAREHLPVLACGAELKNTVCILRGRHGFVSQHIGDLENAETMRFFEESIAHLKSVLQVEPTVVAHDLHPRYLATQWALEQPGVTRIGVQHHHAHIAACLAENRYEGPVIGLALDGTGYGTDVGWRVSCGGDYALCAQRALPPGPNARRGKSHPRALAHGPCLPVRRLWRTDVASGAPCAGRTRLRGANSHRGHEGWRQCPCDHKLWPPL